MNGKIGLLNTEFCQQNECFLISKAIYEDHIILFI